MAKKKRSNSTGTANQDDTGFYEAYVGFARELRVWFLAYGIGGPAIFLTNDTALVRLLSSGSGRIVAYAFLGGVCLQVVLAVLYKSAMWYLYMGELNPAAKDWTLYRVADRISESYWLEVLGDLITLVLFAGATLRLLSIFG